MTVQRQETCRSVESIRSELVRHLQQLVDCFPAPTRVSDAWLDALAMLYGLPLSASEFTVAVNRLKNAHRYLAGDEPGAARYELRLLLSSMWFCAEDRLVKRTFRRRTVSGNLLPWETP